MIDQQIQKMNFQLQKVAGEVSVENILLQDENKSHEITNHQSSFVNEGAAGDIIEPHPNYAPRKNALEKIEKQCIRMQDEVKGYSAQGDTMNYPQASESIRVFAAQIENQIEMYRVHEKRKFVCPYGNVEQLALEIQIILGSKTHEIKSILVQKVLDGDLTSVYHHVSANTKHRIEALSSDDKRKLIEYLETE